MAPSDKRRERRKREKIQRKRFWLTVIKKCAKLTDLSCADSASSTNNVSSTGKQHTREKDRTVRRNMSRVLSDWL